MHSGGLEDRPQRAGRRSSIFGLEGPVVGCLLSDTQLTPGEPIAIGGWAKPALEVEVAIRVGPDGRVAALAPALELVDLGDFFGEIGQILAANICHRGVVFGEEITGGDLVDWRSGGAPG